MNGHELDPIIHPLNRFKICATLAAFGAVEGEVRKEMKFSHLGAEVGLSDTALSKQLNNLQEAGYIDRFREYGSSRGKDTVWVMLTARGLQAYRGNLAALRELSGS